MAQKTQAGEMPPWHAVETEECSPPHSWRDDARLDESTIQMLSDWHAAGAPEGDPATAAPLPEPPSLDLETVTSTHSMGGSVTIDRQGSSSDFFHCLSFDPQLTEDAYLDAFQVLPGNASVVHHVLIYTDETAESASAYGPSGVRENCGGGTGLAGTKLIGAWVPGSLPERFPAGVSARLPAGARLVFNVHYHATGGGPEVDDSTAIALHYGASPTEWTARFDLVGAPASGTIDDPPFFIPAGEQAHEESVTWAVPDFGAGAEVRLFEIANHMHLVGVDMKTTLSSGGGDQCLLQTPAWDFGWQRIYKYDVDIGSAPRVSAGDQVRVQCVYNNSLGNPHLAEGLISEGLEAPVDVSVGEGTLDEMCLAAIGTAYRVP
jgi:hypothetical protein